ncbi:MAG TPA: halogenase, partial [Mycobacterium sp.]|nr:halogenase [Mycobacterium sp.]HUB53872.1 halogenase [Mycobacterium sp.]
MDVHARLSQLSPEARAALTQKIKTRLVDSVPSDHDVAIVGGGVAALTLALEIRRTRPRTRILVVESNPHPVPEI